MISGEVIKEAVERFYFTVNGFHDLEFKYFQKM